MFARVLLLAVVLAGCEKPDHDNLEKWMHTQKGPGKLRQAVTDAAIDADLSAHAAANLIRLDNDREAFAALEALPAARRAEVVGRLARRLWDIARVEDERELPKAAQVAGKDALVRVRPWADAAGRAAIDGYLIDWFCVASYEARANAGAAHGPAVMRIVGPAAAKRLMQVGNGVIAAPGQDQTKNRIGENLLHGLAATGDAEAVKYVLDVARMDRGDPQLASRAVAALFDSYVDPRGAYEVVPPAALVPNLPALVELARDDARPSQLNNDALGLIRAVGAPACFAPLRSMIAAPHRDPRFKIVVAHHALACGGAAAIAEVVRALPESGAYERTQVSQNISGEIAQLTPRDQAVAAARELLGDRATLHKWVAIEALAAMKSTEDASKIAALASSRERLVGYWGARGDGKEDPTLGQRAKELATELGTK